MDPGAPSSLIASLGTPEFSKHYFNFVTRQLPAAQLTIFYKHRAAPHPSTIVSFGSSERDVIASETLSQDYVDWGYQCDPNFSWKNSVTRGCGRLVKSADIMDSSYRSRFYDFADLTEKISLIYENDDDLFYFNLYRSGEFGSFLSDDVANLNKITELGISLVVKHTVIEKYLQTLNFSRVGQVADISEFSLGIADILYMSNPELSKRESEICAQLALGFTPYAVAVNNNISPNTVSTHRKNAYRKLGINSQSQLFFRIIKAFCK